MAASPDAYRLRDEDEFLQLGPEEYFESNGLTFIEWADRIRDCLPADYLEIHCEATGETERRFALTTKSPALLPILKQIHNSIADSELSP